MKRIINSYSFILVFGIILCIFISNLYCMEPKRYPTYEFTIQSASGLQDTDVGRKNKTDAYVVVYVLDKINNRDYVLLEIVKTHIVKETLDPKWNYSFKFTPKNEHESSGMFYFRIVDKDPKMKRDQDIGGCYFKYESPASTTLIVSNRHPSIINLKGNFRRIVKKKRGRLYIKPNRIPVSFIMPNLVGKTQGDAIRLLAKHSCALKMQHVHNEVTDSSKDGRIIAQSCSVGSEIGYGDFLRLNIGKLVRVSVPKLVGLKYNVAAYRLQQLKLAIGTVSYKETSNARKQGDVAAQSVKVHSFLLPGSKVDLTVFKYVQPKPVALPNLVGLNYRVARAKLYNRGFRLGSVTKKVIDKKSNEVIGMNPDPKIIKELPAGSVVSIVLAAPELLGTSLAFPIAKKPGEWMSLAFDKGNEYFVKITSDKKGYVRFLNPQNTESLPLNGEMFILDEGEIATYSNWYARRVFKVCPGEYFFKFNWDYMTGKNSENSLVKFKYEIVPEIDFFEPNNNRSQAAFVMTGTSNKIAIYPANDVDWFCYEADIDGYIRVSFEDIPKGVPSYFEIRVYEEGSEENLHARESHASSIKVFKGKKYFISITVTGPGNAPYAFNMKVNFFPELDLLEPNDTFQTAYPISGDFTGQFYFMGVGEKEYLKLLPPSWARYAVISVSHTESLMSPRVYWGESEKEIDASSYITPRLHPCTLPIDSKKTTYLYLWNEYQTSYSDIPFGLNINYFPGKVTDHSNNNKGNAKIISFDEQKTLVLSPSGDSDWFSFNVSKAKDIYLKIDNLVTFSMRCDLKDIDDNQIARLYLSSDPEKNKFSISKPGKYFLKLYFDSSSDSSHQEMELSLADDLLKLSDDKIEEIDIDIKTDEEKALDFARKAYAKLEDKEYKNSIELYKKALSLDKKREYWHDMGIAFFQQKKWEEAKKYFKESVAMDKNYYLGHKSLGAVYGELKDYKNSMKEFKLALLLTREDPMLYYNIARTYEAIHIVDQSKTDSLKDALLWSKKAFEKIPEDSKVVRQLNRLKEKMKSLKTKDS